MSIEDRLAIQDLNYKYAYYVDMFQIENWLTVFAEDAYFDEREFGNGLWVGHAAIRSYGEELARTTRHAVHLMTNHLIELTCPDRATGVAFALVEGMAKTGERARYQVRYEDEYAKIDGSWKIARRILRKTFPVETVPASAMEEGIAG